MTSLQVPHVERTSHFFDLVIRFSASIPDLILTLPRSPPPNTATLKQEVRSHLPPDFQSRRIRLIYSGKALDDEVLLTSILRQPISRTPSRTSTPTPVLNSQAKEDRGKTPIRDPPSISRIYIHCSIGDVVLSSSDLAQEASLARRHDSTVDLTIQDVSLPSPPPTAPTPRGFDRLLTAGFTAQEVANLRVQFRAIQAHTHTPDTMPSPTTLRDLEDRWLDNSSSATGQESTARRYEDEDTAGQLDDIIWGSIAGFFWPVGVMLWAGREEGIWSRRRKMAVVVGVLVNLGLGVVRWMR